MKKNILSMAVLLMASAAVFTACSNEDNIISEQPVNPTGKYTMTVQASKGDGATTRALSLSGSTLNAMWAEGEAVTVYNVTKSTDLTGTLIAQGSGASTTLKGELSGTIAENDVLTLKFLSPDYNTQDGTLTGSATSIDKVCDYAEATVTVASVAGGNITTTRDADFQNKQSIVKFTLKDKSTDAAISATQLVVNDGTSDYTVTPASATDVLYVALPNISGKTLTLTAASAESAITCSYTKDGVTFADGQYYEIAVKMTKDVDLSKLSGNYEAQNGDVLTGTLAGNYKITVAAGATVTLSDLTINGTNSESYKWAGITCLGNATIILADGTTNTVRGFYEDYPGIRVPTGSTLTIQGDGSLTASSNGYGAGIGGGYNGLSCGNIVIAGGTVTATGAYGAAGIGSGQGVPCGDITISGGTVTATGGSFAAGIGSGYKGSCGSIEITSGVTSVTATKGVYAPNSIGAGNIGSCGTVTIGGTVGVISKSPYTYDPSAPIIRTLAEATAEDLGKIVDADGNIYDTKAAATAAGTTAVAMIAYVGSETDHATYKHGLAIALSDESGTKIWSTAKSTCEGKTAVTDAAWVLPSMNQWKAMFKANGGDEGSYSGLNNALATAGGDSSKLQEIDLYWSSSESDGDQAWPVNLNDGDAIWYSVTKDRKLLVRACLAF